MISEADANAFWLTIRLAVVTTTILLVLGTPLAWWLANTRVRFKSVLEALIALPLILPPTVLGFYLLLALGPRGPLGAAWASVGDGPLVFTFSGLVIGSVIYSLPFVVQPLQASFAALGPRPLEAAATLGASPIDRFFTVAVPLARRGFLSAATLGFAHTLGEFGVVLMIGGAIPGRTRVVSIAVYEHVESLSYADAHALSAVLLLFSFVVLLAMYRGPARGRWP
jgi:molybdate transport system permease protein